MRRGATERVLSTLSYFDGANFAKRVTAPALFSAALHDLTCPPSTVFAAYNRVPGRRQGIDVYDFNDHEGGGGYRWPAQAAFLATARLDALARPHVTRRCAQTRSPEPSVLAIDAGQTGMKVRVRRDAPQRRHPLRRHPHA